MNNKKLITRVLIGLFTSIVFAVLWHYRKHIYYFFLRAFTPRTSKASNNQKIAELHPVFGYKVAKAIKQMENEGRDVIIVSGFRSFEKQEQLYNSGVTPARAGRSYHNYGMAIDINVDSLRMASSPSAWGPIADYMQAEGYRWGGNFSGYYDPVHFDYGNKVSMDQLQELYDSRELFQNTYPIL